jgi:HAD superfamily hydrolase (TIGR01490 family)
MLSGSTSPLIRLAEEIALSHHERWDGKGYPQGLAERDIPLSGRIVAVADVFDALTHERPYKDAWSMERVMNELHAMRERFMTSNVQPMRQTKAAELLQHHRSQGHTLMIITATNHFITEPIADLMGIEHLIATNPEVVNGRFTGEVSGTPSFQGGKVTRLKQWLSENDETLDGAWFYSDSINDAPLLEQVANPVVVDPDPRLEAMARERGWPVMSLRD